MELRGTTCAVTGASSGIGRAVAIALQAQGATVFGVGRNRAALHASVGESNAVVRDLEDPEGVGAELFERAGPIDVLVNCAGLGYAGSLTDLDGGALAELTEVNLVAAIVLTRDLLPAMLERGGGRIVTVSSIAGYTGAKGEAPYAATKAGLLGFTRSLELELEGTGVSTCVLVPGVVATAFFERRGSPYARVWPRPVSPELVARHLVTALQRDRREVFVPRWMRMAAVVAAAFPRLYYPLARRFG